MQKCVVQAQTEAKQQEESPNKMENMTDKQGYQAGVRASRKVTRLGYAHTQKVTRLGYAEA